VNEDKIAKNLLLNRTCDNCKNIWRYYIGHPLEETLIILCLKDSKIINAIDTCMFWESNETK
jgi:hypothetical protein